MPPKRDRAFDDPPSYWTSLTEEDKQAYRHLRKQIDLLTIRTTCRQSAIQFRMVLTKIQEYAIRHHHSDWSRCLVCGVVWLSRGSLAISTHQLCKLVHKCKSSINFYFQSLGYSTVAMSIAHAARLTCLFPFLRDNCAEMRQWTIRSVAEVHSPSPLVIPPGEQLELPELRPLAPIAGCEVKEDHRPFIFPRLAEMREEEESKEPNPE